MTVPRLTPAEARAHAIFSALMWALSYPGRIQLLDAAGLAAFDLIGQALLDLETSYWTNHAGLAQMLARSGARQQLPAAARYQFYPVVTAQTLEQLAQAPVGSYVAPDESAMLVLGAQLGRGQRIRLHGPGIAATIDLAIDTLPAVFWELRARACRFPLGWDIVLLDGRQLVGLPRSTTLEVL